MIVAIRDLEKGFPATLTGSDIEMTLRSINANDPRVSGFQSSTRTIDGMNGAVASMTIKSAPEIFIDTFDAAYTPAIDPTHLMVELISTYPWNEGTLQLLKTIHVEKAK